ncbi:MAG TPA: hypothetical protein VFA68_15185, partial [Terriglobales bacterium]|nr:hypothetical protein [Terriglobales bacterium]
DSQSEPWSNEQNSRATPKSKTPTKGKTNPENPSTEHVSLDNADTVIEGWPIQAPFWLTGDVPTSLADEGVARRPAGSIGVAAVVLDRRSGSGASHEQHRKDSAGENVERHAEAGPPRRDTGVLNQSVMFLYGNLFCYIASYRVLVFHVTRVLDCSKDNWLARPGVDGYVTTILFTVLAFSIFHQHSPSRRYWIAFLLTLAFVAMQLVRVLRALLTRVPVRGCSTRVSPAFGYAYSLARRRGIPAETETVAAVRPGPEQRIVGVNLDDDDEDVTTVRQIVWRRDFMDTYRHMREHGNSAFIFLLELGLAALAFAVISKPGQTPMQQLGAIATLFVIWTIPAVFVHLIGQHLERRFSHFDRRVRQSD